MVTIYFILYLLLSNALVTTQNSDLYNCPTRDLDVLIPGKVCPPSCNDLVCKSASRVCYCDGKCGLSCINTDLRCPVPETIKNGYRKVISASYRGIAEYRCIEGYYFQSGNTIKHSCGSDGTWSGDSAVCLKGCLPPKASETKVPILKEERTAYPLGYFVPYACIEGYSIKMATSKNVLSKCIKQQSFEWTKPYFECVKRKCSYPQIPHGSVKISQLTFGSSLELKCKKGYKIYIGEKLLDEEKLKQICMFENGLVKWNPSNVTCRQLYCGPPPEVKDADRVTYSFNNKYGSIARYSCQQGFKFVGTSKHSLQLRCNRWGTWGQTPICEADLSCDFDDGINPICGLTLQGWKRLKIEENLFKSNGYVLRAESVRNSSSLMSPPFIVNRNKGGSCLEFLYKIRRSTIQSELFVSIVASSSEEVIWRSSRDGFVGTNWWSRAVISLQHQKIFSKTLVRYRISSTWPPGSEIDDLKFEPRKCGSKMEPVRTSTLSVVELLVEDGPGQTGKVLYGWSPSTSYFDANYERKLPDMNSSASSISINVILNICVFVYFV